MSPEEAEAVEAARHLAAAGIPVFTARPALREDGSWDPAGGTGGCGYWLPAKWEETTADLAAVDRWQPGMALAAVCGHGLDVIDVDPRNGGGLSVLNGSLPACYGASATPSGGVHSFIRSLGVRKKTNLFPGVDIQAGDAGGKGRGFVFIAPTVKLSKVTGELAAYRWVRLPDLEALSGSAADQSGEALAELVRASQQGKTAQQSPAASAAEAEAFMREVSPWSDIKAALAEGRNTGVHKLAAALRGQGGWTLETALAHMRETVWPLIDQSQGGHEFTAGEFEQTIGGVWDRYEDGAEQRIAQAADTSPGTVPSGVALTDAYLADRVAAQCLAGRFPVGTRPRLAYLGQPAVGTCRHVRRPRRRARVLHLAPFQRRHRRRRPHAARRAVPAAVQGADHRGHRPVQGRARRPPRGRRLRRAPGPPQHPGRRGGPAHRRDRAA